MARIFEWALLLGLLLAAAWVLRNELGPSRGSGPPAPQRSVAMQAQRLPGSGTLIAGVRLAGALALTSADRGFGGLSGLEALKGGRLLAVSDAGQWLILRPVVRGGQLEGVADVQMGGLPTAPGEPLEMDSEAVRVTPDGRMLVSFEQQQRIMIHDGVPPRRVVGARWPTQAMRWLSNGGGEALALLDDGAMLWLPERPRGGAHRAIFIDAAGRSRDVAVPELPGFAITDAVALDARRLLVLHRRFTGYDTAAAISVIEVAPLRAGAATVPTRTLLRWDQGGPWPMSNMEGLAVVREGGRPVVYLVSDDNFSPVLRTLLLRLELPVPLYPVQ